MADITLIDMEYLSSIEFLCEKLNSLLVQKMLTSNRKCLDELGVILKKQEDEIIRTRVENREELTAKIIELEHINENCVREHPSASSMALELSSELTYEQCLEHLEDKEKLLVARKEKTERLIQEVTEEFGESIRGISEAIRSGDKEFIKKVKLSDDKFRDMLSLRLESKDHPISFGFREALIRERDEKRRKLVAQMFASKDEEHTALYARNVEANSDLIRSFLTVPVGQ